MKSQNNDFELLLPRWGMPSIIGRESKTTLWNGADSETRFKSGDTNPAFGPSDIEYQFNSNGYRGAEFSEIGDFKIVSVGCSYVEGVGLPANKVFHELVAEKLRQRLGCSVVNWNLGYSASSNEYILRNLLYAVPYLKPDFVIVNFTYPVRREHMTAEGKHYRHFTSRVEVARKQPPDSIRDAFIALTSDGDDQINLFRCYKTIESLLERTPWLFSCATEGCRQMLTSFADLSKYVCNVIRVDKARDNVHPGLESQRQMAELYWKRLEEQGELTRFEERVRNRILVAG